MSTPPIRDSDQKLMPIIEENIEGRPSENQEKDEIKDNNPSLTPTSKIPDEAFEVFLQVKDELRKAELPYYLSGDALRIPKDPKDRTFIN